MKPIIIAALALYLFGLLQCFLTFYGRGRTIPRGALFAVGGGFVLHTVSLAVVWWQRGHFPLTSLHESFSFFAWATTLGFFLAYLRYRIIALGAFVLPLVTTFLLLASVLWEERRELNPDLHSYWLFLHTTLIFLAYAAFFVSFISGVMYLIQERELKSKRPSIFYYRLPSLEVCDELSYRSLTIGFPLMTLGIITGILWADSVWGRYWSWEPKESAALATWLIYLGMIFYRWTKGWRRRRSAYLSIIGFIAVLFTFLGVGYFKGLHSF